MITALLAALGFSLLLTIALETGFFLVIGKRGRKDLLLVVMVNILTNPAVVLIYWLAAIYTDLGRVIVIVPLEILAVLTEGFYYKKYGDSFKRPFVFSLAANAISYGLGVLIQLFI